MKSQELDPLFELETSFDLLLLSCLVLFINNFMMCILYYMCRSNPQSGGLR